MFGSPTYKFVHFQLCNGGKLVLHLESIVFFVMLIREVAGGDDAGSQDDKNRDEYIWHTPISCVSPLCPGCFGLP